MVDAAVDRVSAQAWTDDRAGARRMLRPAGRQNLLMIRSNEPRK